MKRDPAIHITRSDLILVLERCEVPDAKSLAAEIVREAKQYEIRGRFVVQGNAAQVKRAGKRSSAECPLTPEKLWRILYAERVHRKHAVITPVNRGDSAWTMLMEIARDAYEFGEQFPTKPLDDAYRQYVSLGLQFMGRTYGLNKFKYYKERIFERKGCEVLVAQDPDPELTRVMVSIWSKAMLKHSRVIPASEDLSVVDLSCFMFARDDAEQVGAKYSTWVEAQFDRLAFMNVVPNLNQFHGEGAMKRYKEYMLKNGRKKTGEITHELPSGGTGNAAHDKYYALLAKMKMHAE